MKLSLGAPKIASWQGKSDFKASAQHWPKAEPCGREAPGADAFLWLGFTF